MKWLEEHREKKRREQWEQAKAEDDQERVTIELIIEEWCLLHAEGSLCKGAPWSYDAPYSVMGSRECGNPKYAINRATGECREMIPHNSWYFRIIRASASASSHVSNGNYKLGGNVIPFTVMEKQIRDAKTAIKKKEQTQADFKKQVHEGQPKALAFLRHLSTGAE